MAPNEASSLLASRPNENHSSVLVLTRRNRESQLTKWGVPPGWGLDLDDFGNEFSGFRQYTSSRSARMTGSVRLEIARPAPKQHSNAAMNAAIFEVGA